MATMLSSLQSRCAAGSVSTCELVSSFRPSRSSFVVFRPQVLPTSSPVAALINGLLALRHFPCEATLVFPDRYCTEDPSKGSSPSLVKLELLSTLRCLFEFPVVVFNDRCIIVDARGQIGFHADLKSHDFILSQFIFGN